MVNLMLDYPGKKAFISFAYALALRVNCSHLDFSWTRHFNAYIGAGKAAF